MPLSQICFVLMPFGKKTAVSGQIIDFDAVYNLVIMPAVHAAGLQPLRADQEASDGIIHRTMLERLVLCDYALADLTTANANVFYELGVRHAAKPKTTVLIFAQDLERLPFDVMPLRAMPYKIGKNGRPAKVSSARDALEAKIRAAKVERDFDSPVYQLLDGYPNIAPHASKHIRDIIDQEEMYTKSIVGSIPKGIDKLKEVEENIERHSAWSICILRCMATALRSLSAWGEIVSLFERADVAFQRDTPLRELYALALNRLRRSDIAEQVLTTLHSERGATSESLGLLGRIYKDRWLAATQEKGSTLALSYLERAIDVYVAGFDADPRDFYPGVNALTLMSCLGRPDTRYRKLLPAVLYSAERKLQQGHDDYWINATMLELSMLSSDLDSARIYLRKAISCHSEGWQLITTERNLRLIVERSALPFGNIDWQHEILEVLRSRIDRDGSGAAVVQRA